MKIGSRMFCTSLFTIAKTWKQMSINRLMDKVDGDTHTHTHNGILLIHKKERMSFAIWMDLEIIIGEGNGTPLQYSCLENPMDGGA